MKKLLVGLNVSIALLALSLQAKTCGDKAQPCQHKTVVIGGGFSGLAAAYELNKEGHDVHLYEAQGRFGGRVRTVKRRGLILEEGGFFIDSEHQYVFDYMHELGLEKIDKLVPKYAGYKVVETYMMDGRAITLSAFYDHFEPIIEYLGRQPFTVDQLDKMSYVDLVNAVPGVSNSFKEAFLQYAEVVVGSEYGENLKDVNANIFYDLMTWDPRKRQFVIDGQIGDERYRIKGGNDGIARAFAAKIPKRRLHRNYRLKAVNQNDNGSYQLEFIHRGRPYWVQSQYLVLTAPLSVYNVVDDSHKAVNFAINLNVKNLPKSTKDAIRSVKYGANYKIILIFKGDIWINESKKLEYVEITHPRFNAWNGGKGVDDGEYSSLTLYVSGENARAFHAPSQVQKMVKAFIKDVQSVLPNATLDNLVEVMPAWHWPSKPLSAGSYTGSYGPRQHGQFEYWIQAPQAGNLVFAGSFWSKDFGGFMNGALETGKKAAEYVLKRATADKVAKF